MILHNITSVHGNTHSEMYLLCGVNVIYRYYIIYTDRTMSLVTEVHP